MAVDESIAAGLWVVGTVAALIGASGLVTDGNRSPGRAFVADSIVYYDISGTASAQVRAELNRLGPVGEDGKRHDALTKGNVKYRATTAMLSGVCVTRSLDVTTEVIITMPKWVNEAKSSASVAKRWREYFAALLLHERGHGTITEDGAIAVRDSFAKLPPQTACDELRRLRSEALSGILERMRQQHLRYDAETQHGRTQGAVFP